MPPRLLFFISAPATSATPNGDAMSRSSKLSKLGRAACNYARNGFHVFPLGPGAKTPIVSNGFLAATDDLEQVRAWWRSHPDANIGMAPGPSGCIVLDLDSPQAFASAKKLGASAADTRAALTGRHGGLHLYYKRPEFRVGNRPIAKHFDVRCDAGYVVLPPSVHPNGTRYRWKDLTRPIADLPSAVSEELRRQDHRVGAPVDSRPKGITHGERNNRLTSFAGTMRHAGAGLSTIVAALREENVARCQPPLGNEEIERIANSVMRYAPEKSEKAVGRMAATQLSSVEPQAVTWLWPAYLPLGKLVLLDGFPGQGKSLAMLDIAARGSRGRPMPDGSRGTVTEAWDTLIITYEDDPGDTLRPRIDAARGKARRIRVVSGVEYAGTKEVQQPAFPDHITALDRLLRRHPETRLVIIDPLMAALSGKIDSHRDQDTRRVTANLARLASHRNVCIVAIRHFRKQTDGNAITAGGGSIGLIGAARVGLIIDKHPNSDSEEWNDVSVLACSKSNLSKHPASLAFRKKQAVVESKTGAVETVRVRWIGEAQLTADELLAAREDNSLGGTHGAVEAMLREILSNGPAQRQDVLAAAHAEGFADRTVDRVASRIGVVKHAEGFGSRRKAYWALPATPDKSTTGAIAAIPAVKNRGANGRDAGARRSKSHKGRR